MKKIIFVLSFLFLASTASFADSSVQFFKKSQATRVVNYLNHHPEVLFYCGCYPNYQTSYVYTLDVWMERYSLTYYEIWIYGYDVKTNEEIYTPVDLNCLWVEGSNGYPANVAKTLGFKHRICEASFRWRIPIYNTRPRVAHPSNYHQTYFAQPNVKPRINSRQQSKPNVGHANNNTNRTNSNINRPKNNNNNGGNNSGSHGNRGGNANHQHSNPQPAATPTNNSTNNNRSSSRR